MIFNFGHFCFGAYTGDPGGEGDCVDFELLKDKAGEGGKAGYGLEEPSESDFAQSKFRLGGADVDWEDDISSNTSQKSPMSLADFSPVCKTQHLCNHHH